MASRILVVEDTLETRDIITILLEMKGYDVIVASDGEEGLKKARDEKPDLIVTDITMPKMDGVEMINRLRSTEGCGAVPILAITAYGMETAEKAIKAGANRAIAQPLSVDLLDVCINEMLKSVEAGRATSPETQRMDESS
jgi:CheY-like chemotaxis protein